MSLYDFKKAVELSRADVPFYALIMAAMLRADSTNIEKLKETWPEIADETQKRYDAPGGIIEGDE